MYWICGSRLDYGFRWFLAGCVIVSSRFRCDTRMIQVNTARSVLVPVGGTCGTSPFPGTINSGGENCFHLPCIFPAGSVLIPTRNDANSLEYTKDPESFGRIRRKEPSTWVCNEFTITI